MHTYIGVAYGARGQTCWVLFAGRLSGWPHGLRLTAESQQRPAYPISFTATVCLVSHALVIARFTASVLTASL